MAFVYDRIRNAVIECVKDPDDLHIQIESKKKFFETFFVKFHAARCDYVDKDFPGPYAASEYQIPEQPLMSLAMVRSVPSETAKFKHRAKNRVE